MRPVVSALFALALTGVAHAQTASQGNADSLENALDGDSNIAGTDEAIEKSKIPMEGAVADSMGEALALDKATDRFETGRPVVALTDGYEKIDLNDMTLDEARDAPVFGLKNRRIGTFNSMNRADSGEFEGFVTIDGEGERESRRLRVNERSLRAARDPQGRVVIYMDDSEEAMRGHGEG